MSAARIHIYTEKVLGHDHPCMSPAVVLDDTKGLLANIIVSACGDILGSEHEEDPGAAIIQLVLACYGVGLVPRIENAPGDVRMGLGVMMSTVNQDASVRRAERRGGCGTILVGPWASTVTVLEGYGFEHNMCEGQSVPQPNMALADVLEFVREDLPLIDPLEPLATGVELELADPEPVRTPAPKPKRKRGPRKPAKEKTDDSEQS